MGGGIWVVGEVDAAGALTKLSGEAATAARALGEAGSREVTGVVVVAEPDGAAASLAAFLSTVLAVRAPEMAGRAASAAAASNSSSDPAASAKSQSSRISSGGSRSFCGGVQTTPTSMPPSMPPS